MPVKGWTIPTSELYTDHEGRGVTFRLRLRRRGGQRTASGWIRFVGQNIKGNPAMAARKVAHDLRVVKRHCDVAVLQEFRLPWYWRTLAKVLGTSWSSYPSASNGLAHPTRGAQAVLWRPDVVTRQAGEKSRQLETLHDGVGGISEDRYLRAVLLAAAAGGAAWCGGTHFVVGGDGPNDGPRRKTILSNDLHALEEFLDDLLATGHAIVFELDANIHVGTTAYARLRRIVESRGGRFIGALGVEYLFVIDGTDTTVEIRN